MLPNRFPDGDASPEYNAVDASLWFIVAVHEFLARSEATGRAVPAALAAASMAILAGYQPVDKMLPPYRQHNILR